MMRSTTTFTCLLAAALLASCDLDNGLNSHQGSPLKPIFETPIGTVNGSKTSVDGSFTVKSLNQAIQVTWQDIPHAQHYNLYYADEPITDFQNYAAFKGAQWLNNVTSPVLINDLVNQRYVYLVLTAVINGHEHVLGNPVSVTAKDIQPSANELLQLELINRARKAPAAEAQRLGIDLNNGLANGTLNNTPKPPLALNSRLVDASRSHSQWMLNTNTFSHTGSNGSSPKTRMETAGYVFSGSWMSGENISWTGTPASSINLEAAIKGQHDGLFKSPGHRVNLLNNNYREMGIGQVEGHFQGASHARPYLSSMLTNKFARSGKHYFFTGVAISASNTSAMFEPGNEYPDVVLEVDGYQYAPFDNGHFSIALQPGTYVVTATAPLTNLTSTQAITIDNSNIKWDLYVTDDELLWVDFMAKP